MYTYRLPATNAFCLKAKWPKRGASEKILKWPGVISRRDPAPVDGKHPVIGLKHHPRRWWIWQPSTEILCVYELSRCIYVNG